MNETTTTNQGVSMEARILHHNWDYGSPARKGSDVVEAHYDTVYVIDVAVPTDGYSLREDLTRAAETLFEQFNQFSAVSGCENRDYFNAGLRSLSVGDIVQFGEVRLFCAPLGWEVL